MTSTNAALCALMALTISTGAGGEGAQRKEMLRQEAEHVCYNDATTLCGDGN